MSEVSSQAKLYTYATLLTSPSTVSRLDHQPLPWFSAEPRLADDPRIRWLTFEEESSEELVDRNSRAMSVDSRFPIEMSASDDQRIDSARVNSRQGDDGHSRSGDEEMKDGAEDAVAGHYLDHIEAVQQKDQNQKKSAKRRKRKSKSASTSEIKAQTSPRIKTEDPQRSATKGEAISEAQKSKPKRRRSKRSRPKN